MKLFIVIWSLFFCCMSGVAAAQSACALQKQHLSAKGAVASASEDDYDVQYVKLDLNVTDTSAKMSGSVTTVMRVTATTMPQYVFELGGFKVVDSVKINGVLRTAQSIGTDVYGVALSNPAAQNTMLTTQVFYHGDSAAYGWRSGNGASFSHAEPYSAKDWWPCKQSLMDKIDSVDVWVTVPIGRKAGSNGILTDTVIVDPSHVQYRWKLRSPVDYYLISVAVANFNEYSYYIHFDGSTDSMLVQNYLMWSFTSEGIAIMDSVGYTINYFSSLFGRYPFWQEKYGHCQVPNYGGAMENQTMTTTGVTYMGTLAHELGHQWFGDNVTCATWSDIWLNEGIASYCEYLYHDHFESSNSAYTYMMREQQSALSYDSGTVYVYDTTDRGRIFSSRLTYDKGSAVMHMLRFVFNNDELFFNMLREYQQRFKHGNANTEDFKHIAEEFYGAELSYFFEQWIYKEGFPKYEVQWNQVGNVVYVKLKQQGTVPGSVAFFRTPVEIKLFSASGDTTLRLENDAPEQQFHLICSKPVDSIAFDPKQWLMYRMNAGPAKVAELNLLTDDIQVFPNPVKDVLSVSGMKLDDTYIKLSDMNGKTVLETKLQVPVGENQIDVRGLPTGVYLYNIVQGKNVRLKGKFVKLP